MTTPADFALHAADRMAAAGERVTELARRQNLVPTGYDAPSMAQERMAAFRDLDSTIYEYRAKARRVPKDQSA